MAFSFGKKYNRERKFNIDTKGFEYHTLEDLYTEYGKSHIYPVRGIWKNTKSKYGLAAVLATNDCYVNVPKHMTDICLEMLNDEETIDYINSGHAAFSIYTYQKTDDPNTYYGINWEDIGMNQPEN